MPSRALPVSKGAAGKGARFDEVIDTSSEKLADGVRRITEGYGADIVIDGSVAMC